MLRRKVVKRKYEIRKGIIRSDIIYYVSARIVCLLFCVIIKLILVFV